MGVRPRVGPEQVSHMLRRSSFAVSAWSMPLSPMVKTPRYVKRGGSREEDSTIYGYRNQGKRVGGLVAGSLEVW